MRVVTVVPMEAWDRRPSRDAVLAGRVTATHVATATRTLLRITGVSAASVACAWLAAFCFACGDIFAGVSPREQSDARFLAAALLWTHLFFCFIVWVTRSSSLFDLELTSRPHRRAGAVRSLTLMFRGTIAWFVILGAASVGTGHLTMRLPPAWRRFKLEMYACAVWSYSYTAVADIAARRIYRHKSVQGIQRARAHALAKRQLQSSQTLRGPRRRAGQQLANSLVVISPMLASIVVPTLYVHVISCLQIVGSLRLVGFTVASLALKILMQELAKLHILRKRVFNSRTMAVLVCLPTVMIDTQVRIVFLRYDSVHVTVSTTLAMAFFEMATRAAKALLLRWQIQRARQLGHRRTSAVATTPAPSSAAREALAPMETTPSVDFGQWRTHVCQHYATELAADMYAEYLAIGCSHAIRAFFWTHPKYQMGGTGGAAVTSARFGALALQIGVELVVDVVCCILEAAGGIDVLHFDQDRTYVLVLLVLLALVNINVSALLYLAVRPDPDN